MTHLSPDSPSPDGRSVDVALAEFTALRAELLAYSTSQNTFVGLGFTAIGVLGGIAIPRPEQRVLLILVPFLCSILILVYAGLAYRIVVTGNYIHRVLWPWLRTAVGDAVLPSWEASLAGLESREPHKRRSQIVEFALVLFLLAIGIVAAATATGAPALLRVVAGGLLVLVTGSSVWIGRRRVIDADDFRE